MTLVRPFILATHDISDAELDDFILLMGANHVISWRPFDKDADMKGFVSKSLVSIKDLNGFLDGTKAYMDAEGREIEIVNDGNFKMAGFFVS